MSEWRKESLINFFDEFMSLLCGWAKTSDGISNLLKLAMFISFCFVFSSGVSIGVASYGISLGVGVLQVIGFSFSSFLVSFGGICLVFVSGG